MIQTALPGSAFPEEEPKSQSSIRPGDDSDLASGASEVVNYISRNPVLALEMIQTVSWHTVSKEQARMRRNPVFALEMIQTMSQNPRA